jgi:hypothetical protein
MCSLPNPAAVVNADTNSRRFLIDANNLLIARLTREQLVGGVLRLIRWREANNFAW